MPIDEEKVLQVHIAVRAHFKGKIKSANKVYDPDFLGFARANAMLQKIDVRNKNAERADPLLDKIRESKSRSGNYVQYGFEVMHQEDDKIVGNCLEMAAAAAYLVMRNRVGIAWVCGIERPGDHAFCLVDNGASFKPKKVIEFRHSNADAWIIDPWANICCSMQTYGRDFGRRMQRWSAQGKRIVVVSPDGLRSEMMDPSEYQYQYGFHNGPINYARAGLRLPESVPKALATVFPESERVKKAAGCCVIL